VNGFIAYDPLRVCVALAPLGLYLVLIGRLNLARRPTVISGGRDLAALAVGLAGLVIVGPIELLLPDEAASLKVGPYLWLMALTLYSLVGSLAALLIRPRLVVYAPCSQAEFRTVLGAVADELDPQSRSAGNSVAMPSRQIEFVIEHYALLNCTALTATTGRQDLDGWRDLHRALTRHLRGVSPRRSRWGVGLVTIGLAIVAAIGWQLAAHPQEVVQSFQEAVRG
jgi:uncharacterized membrane protein